MVMPVVSTFTLVRILPFIMWESELWKSLLPGKCLMMSSRVPFQWCPFLMYIGATISPDEVQTRHIQDHDPDIKIIICMEMPHSQLLLR